MIIKSSFLGGVLGEIAFISVLYVGEERGKHIQFIKKWCQVNKVKRRDHCHKL